MIAGELQRRGRILGYPTFSPHAPRQDSYSVTKTQLKLTNGPGQQESPPRHHNKKRQTENLVDEP